MLRARSLLVLLIIHRNQALSFIPLMSSNGAPVCAYGKPSYTIKTDDIIGVPYVVPGATKCGFFCTGLNSRITCTGFNYLIDGSTSGLCQFFSNPCLHDNWTFGGCWYYQASQVNQSSTCLQVSSPICSFPYTYQGQLYYECTVFNTPTGSLDIGCYSAGGMQSCPLSKCYDVRSNVALKQAASQESTYYIASFAVDGDVTTKSCTYSTSIQGWWSVDLGQPYNVIMISVLDDPSPIWFGRMTNFYAWLSNTQPIVAQPLNTSKCSLCRQYNGTFSTSQLTGNVTCQLTLTKFRHVIIQASHNSAICLVEVQVYVEFVTQTVDVSIPTTPSTVPLMSVNGWLTIMSRMNSNFPASLNWAMYKSGFGDITSNFWLGLERIFQLTNVNNNGGVLYQLRFELQSNSGRWYSEEYERFYIENEAQFYKLHVSLFAVGDAGDSLNSPLDPRKTSNGMEFSSPDVDNDLSSGNCAHIQDGGWWYNDCSASNQLGRPGMGYMWGTLNPGEMSLMASRMMIKSIN